MKLYRKGFKTNELYTSCIGDLKLYLSLIKYKNYNSTENVSYSKVQRDGKICNVGPDE